MSCKLWAAHAALAAAGRRPRLALRHSRDDQTGSRAPGLAAVLPLSRAMRLEFAAARSCGVRVAAGLIAVAAIISFSSYRAFTEAHREARETPGPFSRWTPRNASGCCSSSKQRIRAGDNETGSGSAGVVHSGRRGKHIPRVVLQYGKPRSASTLQFITLCTVVRIRVAPKKVTCVFVQDGRHLKLKLDASRHYVFKTHDPQWLTRPPTSRWTRAIRKAWLFVSTRDEKVLPRFSRPVQYVQTPEAIAEMGPKSLEVYSRLFGLTTRRTQELVVFLRLWSILRRCCAGLGRPRDQMSSAWRKQLLGIPVKQNLADPWQLGCGLYNIDSVQHTWKRTSLYKYWQPEGEWQINCSRANAWVAQRGSRGNAKLPISVRDRVYHTP
mmetsp:Transcript_97524/g.226083  ORF Transcript_97524/g.226083 Transcript_97524/m.226083 type:complete len:382 (+) Transcript_97524:31-1176(+)